MHALCTRRNSLAKWITDERNFVKALEWIPERFSTSPELTLDKSAFVPWSEGKHSKNLPYVPYMHTYGRKNGPI